MRCCLPLGLACTILACASTPEVAPCVATDFSAVPAPPWWCRSSKAVTTFLGDTVQPQIDLLLRHNVPTTGAIAIRASFDEEAGLDRYCVSTDPSSGWRGQNTARQLRAALEQYGRAPDCLAGTRLLLLDVDLLDDERGDRAAAVRDTLHRGRRMLKERNSARCGKGDTLASLACLVDARAEQTTLTHESTGEEMLFASDSPPGIPAVRALDECDHAWSRKRLLACMKRRGWTFLSPDPAPF